MHGQWSLQIIWTYWWNSYLGHVNDSLGNKNENIEKLFSKSQNQILFEVYLSNQTSVMLLY